MRASIMRCRLALLAAACEESPWGPENPFATFTTDAATYTPGAFVGDDPERVPPADQPRDLSGRGAAARRW